MQRYAIGKVTIHLLLSAQMESIFSEPISFLFILILTAGIALVIQLYYFFFTFLRLAIKKNQKPEIEEWPLVSVIICARNEEENLLKNLPLVLNQHYPKFEVVVVNDCSYDGTTDVLKAFASQYPHLVVTEIKEVEGREHFKKFAQTMGIKKAKHEILIFTDADCAPSSENWLMYMVSAYRKNTEIVLGYGPYSKHSGLLNSIIRFDAFFIGVQYLSMAIKNNAYMGVGRNLSYKRSLFFNNKGFASHMHLMGGDDDLFVNENATATNVAVCIHKDAQTYSEPKKTWKSWFWQKKRHHLTARYYKSRHQTALALYPFSFYLFTISTIAALVFQYQMLIFLSAFGLRALVQMIILHLCSKKLNEKNLGMVSPLLELVHRMLVYPVYLTSTIFMRKRLWK